ncbi:unnamed protein product [Effrenium voratum]|uniref:Zeta toxin domain-containing protein n=1 Tax=Effrenium voratum TaxID=2562239 RepID=A0AA36J0Z8_9DINO|nr:unnamed protein product [Effrenium voratum]
MDLSAIRSLRGAVRCGPGVRWDFATRQALPGRVWHPEFPDAAALSRDMSEDELRAVRQAARLDAVPAVEAPERPAVLVIIGPSGAGKTMIAPLAAEKFGLDFDCFAEVDGDQMRGCHNVWRQHVVEDHENGYFDAYEVYTSNKKNKGLKVQYLTELLKARKNVIYPDTHVKDEDLALMKEQGYQIYTLALLISRAESDCRQRNRAEETGRWSGTPMKKWLATMADVLKMCDVADQVLAYDSTDVLSPRLVLARGLPGVVSLDELRPSVEALKADASWKPLQREGHAWCETLSLVGRYRREDGGVVEVTVLDPCQEVTEVQLNPPPAETFRCVFSAKTCCLHLPGAPVGEKLARLEVTTQRLLWDSGPWRLEEKLPGSICRGVREDARLLSALDLGGGQILDFCAGPFRALLETDWSAAKEACLTGSWGPKALLVMSPSAGGKTTVVSRLLGSFGISSSAAKEGDDVLGHGTKAGAGGFRHRRGAAEFGATDRGADGLRGVLVGDLRRPPGDPGARRGAGDQRWQALQQGP